MVRNGLIGSGSNGSDDAGCEVFLAFAPFGTSGLVDLGIFAFLDDLGPLGDSDSHSTSAGAIRAT